MLSLGSRVLPPLAVLLAALVAGCTDNSARPDPSPNSPSAASDEVGCGLADEDLVVKAIGTDVRASGTGVLPPEQADFQVMTCDVQSVSDPLTFMTIRVDTPPPDKLAAGKRSWPTSVQQMDCPGAWLAPGPTTYAAACIDDNAPPGAKATFLRALTSKYVIAVAIVRPRPRPDDAETAFRISRDVATRLP